MDDAAAQDDRHAAPSPNSQANQCQSIPAGSGWVLPDSSKLLADMFDSQQHFPDANIIIGSRTIHLHKCIVARGCSAFASRWTSNWADSTNSQDSAILDTACCDACGIQTSYDTARTFFRCLYTSEVQWPTEQPDEQPTKQPDKQPDMGAAMKLLVLADLYKMPYLVCAAEQALKSSMTASQYCQVLLVADYHSAQQLRKYCLHVSRCDMVSQHPSFQQVTDELLDQTREALQQLDDQ